MPKMKSHRGAKKRFRVTKNGLIKHKSMNLGHIMTKKKTKRTRQLRKDGFLNNTKEAATIRRLIG
ncbi:MAG TPA: 50S ribosomal protein L35 [Candidatus Limnocylindria bacterium]|nr:50S ribosomal protein L35 [Candidatus Limnocylindria bacterium]